MPVTCTCFSGPVASKDELGGTSSGCCRTSPRTMSVNSSSMLTLAFRSLHFPRRVRSKNVTRPSRRSLCARLPRRTTQAWTQTESGRQAESSARSLPNGACTGSHAVQPWLSYGPGQPRRKIAATALDKGYKSINETELVAMRYDHVVQDKLWFKCCQTPDPNLVSHYFLGELEGQLGSAERDVRSELPTVPSPRPQGRGRKVLYAI